MTFWQRWVRQPQAVWLRKALFQVHLWTGIGVGLYVVMISLTGSVLIYRVELLNAFTPEPIIAVASGERLTDEQLKEAAVRVYPGYSVTSVTRAKNPNQAVDVWMKRDGQIKQRQFDPYTGKDLAESVPPGIRRVSWLLDLHDNLLLGGTGRIVNGVGALLVTVLGLTGLVVWWPGVRNWRRSVILHRKKSWKRFNWDLHSAMGFWTLGFILLFGITGIYLGNPDPFINFGDYLQPLTEANAGSRVVDQVIYWLAYLHFGRFGGRFPGCRLTCDWTFKAIWAVFGLVPACMLVTGTLMWWNRVLRRGARFSANEPLASAAEPIGPV